MLKWHPLRRPPSQYHSHQLAGFIVPQKRHDTLNVNFNNSTPQITVPPTTLGAPPHPKIPAASSTIFANASGFAPRIGLKYFTFRSLKPQKPKICRRNTFTQPLP